MYVCMHCKLHMDHVHVHGNGTSPEQTRPEAREKPSPPRALQSEPRASPGFNIVGLAHYVGSMLYVWAWPTLCGLGPAHQVWANLAHTWWPWCTLGVLSPPPLHGKMRSAGELRTFIADWGEESIDNRWPEGQK